MIGVPGFRTESSKAAFHEGQELARSGLLVATRGTAARNPCGCVYVLTASGVCGDVGSACMIGSRRIAEPPAVRKEIICFRLPPESSSAAL